MEINLMKTPARVAETAQADWGLTGWSKVIANLGVIGVICLVLIMTLNQFFRFHEEGLAVFREEMKLFREDARTERDTNYKIQMVLEKAIRSNQGEILTNQQLMISQQKTLESMVKEIKVIKERY